MRAFKLKWIAKEGAGFVRAVRLPYTTCACSLEHFRLSSEAINWVGVQADVEVDAPADETAVQLREVQTTRQLSAAEAVLKDLQKRKLITARYVRLPQHPLVSLGGTARATRTERTLSPGASQGASSYRSITAFLPHHMPCLSIICAVEYLTYPLHQPPLLSLQD